MGSNKTGGSGTRNSKNGKSRKALVRQHMAATGQTYQAANAALGREGNNPTVEEVVEWFLAHFEDPANGVLREDGEHFYINGGPYDARDEIGDYLDDMPAHILEAALTIIHRQAFDWVKVIQYP